LEEEEEEWKGVRAVRGLDLRFEGVGVVVGFTGIDVFC